jgi:hypothetical protein
MCTGELSCSVERPSRGPRPRGGVNEVSLRSGDEAHLIALANALVDARF